jgi:hypothetical protein
MAKSTLEQQEACINLGRKNVKYDTKEYTLEHLFSKFNRPTEDNKQTEIFIPFYQRKFVWKQDRQSKFIESILLGLPIPPMYFAEMDEGVLEVIDGSQRIKTINAFLSNNLKLKRLKSLDDLNGISFNDLSSSRKRKINNVSMRAVVVTDIEKDTMSIRHEIFERLNTGGEVLKKMEVKKGANEGDFINFIYKNCAENTVFNDLSQFNTLDELRAYKEEFLVKYFAYVEDMDFEDSIVHYLGQYLIDKNTLFEDDTVKDNYLEQFTTILDFVKNNNLIKDISINRKNRLLAIYIGATLALKENPSLLDNPVDIDLFNDNFIENAKSSGFSKLKENVELVKNSLCRVIDE